MKDKKGNLGRALCTKKTLKDVKKAERAWTKRPENSKIIFKDWLHTFELEIQTFVNMNEIEKGETTEFENFKIIFHCSSLISLFQTLAEQYIYSTHEHFTP